MLGCGGGLKGRLESVVGRDQTLCRFLAAHNDDAQKNCEEYASENADDDKSIQKDDPF